MLTWMLYVVAITLLLSGAALAAERAARLRRARTRWIWAMTIVASLGIPTLIASVSIQVPNLLTPTVSQKVTALRELTFVQVVPLNWVHEHTGNIVATHSENRTLQRAWIAVSGAVLAALVLNALHVLWRKRGWRMGTIAGISVYIALDAGPAVVGLLRPRIVVPEWLAETSPSRQAMVVAHEQSHLSARDPQVLTVVLFLLVLMPWNLPLWWQLHRLRRAIEVDCDARVLKGGVDTGLYGETLIDVSQRPSGYVGSVAAMSESRSFLEERITIMVRDPAKWWAAVMFACLALTLVTIAAQVSPPNVGSSITEQRPVILAPAVLDRYVGFYVRGGHMVFEFTREASTLFVQLSFPTWELVANSETDFSFKDGGGPEYSFARDAQGHTTGVVSHFGKVFSYTIPRVDASAAQEILARNHNKFLSQIPTPGSEVALRRYVNGVLAGRPNYEEMAPWFAQLNKDTLYITVANYARLGALQSIEFRHVDSQGADVYEVRQEHGISSWTIFVDSSGVIQDADNNRE